MSVIAIIPARGGSTRIPRKNIRDFMGKPIIAYSIEAALESGLFDSIVVSTDDPGIAKVANEYGAASVLRSAEMSTNDVGTQEVMRHVLRKLFYDDSDIACCIYATAPLMSVDDLCRGYQLLNSGNYCRYVFSVGTDPLQDAGQFYWGWVRAFTSGDPLHENAIMVPISDDRTCDINTEEDWLRAEQMYLALRGGV